MGIRLQTGDIMRSHYIRVIGSPQEKWKRVEQKHYLRRQKLEISSKWWHISHRLKTHIHHIYTCIWAHQSKTVENQRWKFSRRQKKVLQVTSQGTRIKLIVTSLKKQRKPKDYERMSSGAWRKLLTYNSIPI